jgi:hypothetical protein
MSSCGLAGLSVADPLQRTPRSVASPLQRGSLEIAPEFCSALRPIETTYVAGTSALTPTPDRTGEAQTEEFEQRRGMTIYRSSAYFAQSGRSIAPPIGDTGSRHT